MIKDRTNITILNQLYLKALLNPQWLYMLKILLSKESDWIAKLNGSEVDRWLCCEIFNCLQVWQLPNFDCM